MKYFSILINNDTGKRLEVVPYWQQPEVIKMIRKFKQVETVVRDFSKSYKAAISEALSNARQIVDRFHIMKNLTEDMTGYLKCKINDNVKAPDLSTVPITEKEVSISEYDRASHCMQVTELDSFLKLIRSDKEAVKNAIRYYVDSTNLTKSQKFLRPQFLYPLCSG